MSVSSQTPPHDEQSVLELELEHSREAPSMARAAISAFSENRDLDAATLATLTLLVSEVVTNAVIHPDVEPPCGIRLAARITEGRIRVEVTDEGSGFEPAAARPREVRPWLRAVSARAAGSGVGRGAGLRQHRLVRADRLTRRSAQAAREAQAACEGITTPAPGSAGRESSTLIGTDPVAGSMTLISASTTIGSNWVPEFGRQLGKRDFVRQRLTVGAIGAHRVPRVAARR